MNKIKIAFIAFPEILLKNGSAIKSGSLVANEQLMNCLVNSGFEVQKYYPRSPKRLALRSVPGFGNLLMFQDLAKQADKINKCDLIISTNYFGLILPEIKKSILTIFHHCAKSISNELKRAKSNFWQNQANFLTESNELIETQIASRIEQHVIDRSEKIVAVSEDLADEISCNYPNSKNKIVVIHNSSVGQSPVAKHFDNTLKLIALTRAPKSKTGFYLKGIDRYCEIFSKIEDYQKALIASTDDEAGYKRFFEKNLNKTKTLFNLPHSEVYKMLGKSHVSIHCSRLESFGLTLVESMQMGNIVITFPVGAARKIINHGKNGFIVRNVGEILSLLKKLNAPNFRPKLKEISQEAVKTTELFEPEKTLNKYSALINSVLKK